MRRDVQKYVGLLGDISDYLQRLGSDLLARKFAEEARQLSKAVNFSQVKQVQQDVKLHLIGTIGAFTDVMSLNENGKLSREDIEQHKVFVSELRKFTRKLFL